MMFFMYPLVNLILIEELSHNIVVEGGYVWHWVGLATAATRRKSRGVKGRREDLCPQFSSQSGTTLSKSDLRTRALQFRL